MSANTLGVKQNIDVNPLKILFGGGKREGCPGQNEITQIRICAWIRTHENTNITVTLLDIGMK